MNQDLFDPDLKKRYSATIDFCAGEEKRQYGCWPDACWNAANAWVLLVGPSPGKADAGERRDQNTRVENPVCVGRQVGVVSFPGSPRRNRAWNRLAVAFAGGEEAAALTGIANLDWVNSAREKGIKDEQLIAGAPVVWKVIAVAKPRLVIALTHRVYDILLQGQIKPYPDRSFEMPNPPPRKPIVFHIPGFQALSVLCMSPRHPSYGFGKNQIAEADAIRSWFIREVEAVRLS